MKTLNRALLLPILLAGCSGPAGTAATDQAAAIEELQNRVAALEDRADTVEDNQKTVAAAAAVSLKRPVSGPADLGTDRAFDRIKELESDKIDRDYGDAQRNFKEAVAK